MANIRLIKRRIKSAKNIAQITKAMELVAASKMKKAQAAAVSGRMYAQKIHEMMMRLAPKIDVSAHELLKKRVGTSGKTLVIFISTNKGLCGGLNTNLFRFFHHAYPGVAIDGLTVGQKGADFLLRSKKTVVADFSKSSPFTSAVAPIIAYAVEQYAKGMYDRVDIVYSEFISALKQEPKVRTILPLTVNGSAPHAEASGTLNVVVEPSPEAVFAELVPHYLENQVRDAILSAEASEHSARMIAMRNATDNALGLVDDLTLVYNKARQEKITYEITDMVTARLSTAG